MAHRIHPKALRIRGINSWHSRGFYEKNIAEYLEMDLQIRTFLRKNLKTADVEKIEIERFPAKVNVIIFSARPGLIIGRRGENVTLLRNKIEKILSDKEKSLKIEIRPVKNPWLSASLTAQHIAQQIEKRTAFRRVLKQSLSKIMSNKSVQGARVQVAGRLNGTEMARTEWLKQGKLPRQTIRAKIDYSQTEAFCSYGVVGVKVWIYTGEENEKDESNEKNNGLTTK